MINKWEEIYNMIREKAMMKFPFSIVMELEYFYKNKYPNILPENINVLEIGCGSGSNIKYLAELGYNVYGIDISETAVNYAKKSFNQSNLKGNIQIASVENLPFQDNMFHIVIDSGCLVCVNESAYKKAVDEIHRVMIGGGIALLTLKSEISTSSVRLKKDDNTNNCIFKDFNIYINNIGLYEVIRILDNRFNIVFLRRNDKINYIISDDYKSIKGNNVDSVYFMFIEKL